MSNEKLIESYKELYSKVSNHKGARYQVLKELKKLIDEYSSFIDKIKNNEYSLKYKFEEKIKEIELFVSNTFSNKQIIEFLSNPKLPITIEKDNYENHEPSSISVAQMVHIFASSQKEKKEKEYFEKIGKHESRLKNLSEVYQCIKDYGLHKEINNRSESQARFNILIEHNHNINKKKNELIIGMNLSKLNKILQLYNEQKSMLINGTTIPFSSILRFKVSKTLFKEDEIKLFKAKHGIKNDLSFFKKCDDLTNDLLEDPSLGKTVELNQDIWNLIHPKIANSAKEAFFKGLFSEAVLSACIELNHVIKEEYKKSSGVELDGSKLMQKVFSVSNPVFKLSGDIQTESGRNIQQGYMEMFAGLMIGVRNPKAHKNIKISAIDALEKIIIVSHLMKKFENRSK